MSNISNFKMVLLIEKFNQIGLAPKLVYELSNKYLKLISEESEAFFLYCEVAFGSFPHEIQNPEFFKARYKEFTELEIKKKSLNIRKSYETKYSDTDYDS